MFYSLSIYDSNEEYDRAICGDQYINCVTMTIEGEEKAFETLKTALACGKAVTVQSSETPF